MEFCETNDTLVWEFVFCLFYGVGLGGASFIDCGIFLW